MDIGRVGIWTFRSSCSRPRGRARRRRSIEALGYGAIWIPEAIGREAFAHSGAAPRRARSASPSRPASPTSGGATRWRWRPAQKTLAEAYPDRFLLGIGVSHAPLVGACAGTRYEQAAHAPCAQYLDAMDSALVHRRRRRPSRRACIGALAPKMLALAAERTDGAHPYFVPPEHTRARARPSGRSSSSRPSRRSSSRRDPADGARRSRAPTWRCTSSSRTT